MQTISVRTTQNVFIQYPIASLGDRIVAYLIDLVITIAYVILVIMVIASSGSMSEFVLLGMFLPVAFYHLLFEIFMDGQSPGKRQMSIKVVRIDGTPATVGNYVIRWVLRLIDIQFLSGIVALVAIGAGGRGQRIGDIAAGTTVVKLVPQREVTASEVFTLADDNYKPMFDQVLQLNDNDIELIQQAIRAYHETGNAQPMNVIGEKIESKLGIQTDLEAYNFLSQVVKDYAHLSAGK